MYRAPVLLHALAMSMTSAYKISVGSSALLDLTSNQSAAYVEPLTAGGRARIIGGTKKMTPAQISAVADRLKQYDQVDWDGDGVEVYDSVNGGSFTQCLTAGDNPFFVRFTENGDNRLVLQKSRVAVPHYLPNTPQQYLLPDNAGANRIMHSDVEANAAGDAITTKLGSRWKEAFGGSEQYVRLAVATLHHTPPQEIFWLYDDRREKNQYASWVSLAEWVFAHKSYKYTIIDSEGITKSLDINDPYIKAAITVWAKA